MRVLSPVLTSALAFCLLLSAGVAHAQEVAVGGHEASASGKGIVGGALLGAEAVLAVESALKVKSTWAYVGGGVAGGVVGGVGGYFVEQSVDSARVPMLMLAVGLTAAIPTTVWVLSASAYEPPATYVVDTQPADEPVADPAKPVQPAPAATPAGSEPAAPSSTPPAGTGTPATGTEPSTAPGAAPPPAGTPAPTSGRARNAPRVALREQGVKARSFALIDVQPRQVNLSIPAVEVREVFSRAEVAMGAPKAMEVRIPVLNVLF